MSSEKFTITEHVVPGCHIREYPGSTVQQEDVLGLHVKQYTPQAPSSARSSRCHYFHCRLWNGSAEGDPFFDLISRLICSNLGRRSCANRCGTSCWNKLLEQAAGFHVRSIWVADCASMNISGIQNEDKLSMDCMCTQYYYYIYT